MQARILFTQQDFEVARILGVEHGREALSLLSEAATSEANSSEVDEENSEMSDEWWDEEMDESVG